MKLEGRAHEAALKIIEALETDNLPAALAQVLAHPDTPCRKWSYGNRLMCILFGTSDARGYRQWQEIGRQVKKGAKSFPILVPMTRTITDRDKESGEDVKRCLKQTGPARFGAAHLILEDPLALCAIQRVPLKLQMLVFRADPRVAD
jgi:hypothetical protein